MTQVARAVSEPNRSMFAETVPSRAFFVFRTPQTVTLTTHRAVAMEVAFVPVRLRKRLSRSCHARLRERRRHGLNTDVLQKQLQLSSSEPRLGVFYQFSVQGHLCRVCCRLVPPPPAADVA